MTSLPLERISKQCGLWPLADNSRTCTFSSGIIPFGSLSWTQYKNVTFIRGNHELFHLSFQLICPIYDIVLSVKLIIKKTINFSSVVGITVDLLLQVQSLFIRQSTGTNCAMPPNASAAQYATANCKLLLFGFLCKWWYINVGTFYLLQISTQLFFYSHIVLFRHFLTASTFSCPLIIQLFLVFFLQKVNLFHYYFWVHKMCLWCNDIIS